MSENRQGYRTERRTTRRAARRKKRNRRLFGAAAPAVVVIAVAVTLFILWGGGSDEVDDRADPTTTTRVETQSGAAASHLLVAVADGGSAATFALLSRTDKGVLVLGMPGTTLLRTDSGFDTLEALHGDGAGESLLAGIGSDLGREVEGLVDIRWSDLQEALHSTDGVDAGSGSGGEGSGDADPGAIPPLSTDLTGALRAADALAALLDRTVADGAGIWERLEVEGDGAALLAMISAISKGAADHATGVAVLPGKVVEGRDFLYYEPDVEAAKAVLAADLTAEPERIVLQVQNGSGIIEAAQAAGTLLEPLGYTMGPFQNAQGFPDVAATAITAAPDALKAAARVWEVLEVGAFGLDDELESGHVVVVVGKDFVPPTSGG